MTMNHPQTQVFNEFWKRSFEACSRGTEWGKAWEPKSSTTEGWDHPPDVKLLGRVPLSRGDGRRCALVWVWFLSEQISTQGGCCFTQGGCRLGQPAAHFLLIPGRSGCHPYLSKAFRWTLLWSQFSLRAIKILASAEFPLLRCRETRDSRTESRGPFS